jgi:hypothetical protein
LPEVRRNKNVDIFYKFSELTPSLANCDAINPGKAPVND